mmetsp:Transcript_2414/g.7998  ORF Transcript_2414/g.7998 Transcript_2414/m.7998 type:complete len:214 (-) Transcript_2414:91-732(-)
MRGKQYVRKVLYEQMEGRGASCSPERGCRLCAGSSLGCGADSRATGVFGEALRARLCVEPPGDTLGRSHFAVAVAAGCIPVVVDGGHRSYDEDEPTWWPWRLPSGEAARAGDPTSLDYSRFAVVVNGSQATSGNWLDAVLRVSEDRELWRSMREALAEVAPQFRYARSAAAARPTPDAFATLLRLLQRVHDASIRFAPVPRGAEAVVRLQGQD